MTSCDNGGDFNAPTLIRVVGPGGMDPADLCPTCAKTLRNGSDMREAYGQKQR